MSRSLVRKLLYRDLRSGLSGFGLCERGQPSNPGIPKRGRRTESGFTLVETLVAIVILMIVIGSIYGAFRAANMCVMMAQERSDAYQTARILSAQINGELCSAYQRSGASVSSLVGEDTPSGQSAVQCDRMTFLTTGRRSQATTSLAGDLRQVTYFEGSTDDGKPLGLFMQEDLQPGLGEATTDAQPVKLSDRVISFNCKYYDPDSQEWANEWKDRSKLPAAVRVEMAIQPERDGAKPIIVATTANMMITSGPGSEQAEAADDVK